MNLAPYRKTVTAIVTGMLGWAAVVITSDPAAITASEWLMGATALATALGVFAVANEPDFDDAGQANAAFIVVFLIGIFVGAVMHDNGWLFN